MIWHWLYVHFGLSSANSPWYLGWSGGRSVTCSSG